MIQRPYKNRPYTAAHPGEDRPNVSARPYAALAARPYAAR